MLLQVNPALTPLQVYSILEETAIDMGVNGFDFDSGFGLIDAEAAVSAAVQTPTSEPSASPSNMPSQQPSTFPSNEPSMQPTTSLSSAPTSTPPANPSKEPSPTPPSVRWKSWGPDGRFIHNRDGSHWVRYGNAHRRSWKCHDNRFQLSSTCSHHNRDNAISEKEGSTRRMRGKIDIQQSTEG